MKRFIQRKRLQWYGLLVIAVGLAAVGWFVVGGDSRRQMIVAAVGETTSNRVSSDVKTDETAITPSRNPRLPMPFQAKRVDAVAAVWAVLGNGELTVEERVRRLQGMRGIEFSKEERERALAFLGGNEIPQGMGKGSMHWLADELLTALRLQNPAWDGLASELSRVAFQGNTDPVVRDYILQHLGQLWEQEGSSKEIETALWHGVVTQGDETSAGSALIALDQGYARDQNAEQLAEVRVKAFEMAQDGSGSLATRVTALSIAGEGNDPQVKEYSEGLAANNSTPLILKKVAQRVAAGNRH